MSRLASERLSKVFANQGPALDGVSFTVAAGEFFSIVGPTNAGKSTLLKLIAGLHAPSGGRVLLDGRDVTRLEPARRGLSLMFQNIALFPNRTGRENIAYPLARAGLPEPDTAARVAAVAGTLQVAHLLDRLPQTYSGGEQQRVAIARAIAAPSRLLMLDEPLTNLDARLRIALRMAFRSLHRDTGQTVLYVTHDQAEAMSLSDRILVLNGGRIEQVGTPDEIYHRPATRFVAEFIGTPPMNILASAAAEDGPASVGPGVAKLLASKSGGARSIGIRPEDVIVSPAETPDAPLPGEIVWVERLGSRNVLQIRIRDQAARAVVQPDHPLRQPGPAWFGLPTEKLHLLDDRSGRFVRPGTSY